MIRNNDRLSDEQLKEAFEARDHNAIIESFYPLMMKYAVEAAQHGDGQAEEYLAEMTFRLHRMVDTIELSIGQFTAYAKKALKGCTLRQSYNDANQFTGMGEEGRNVFSGKARNDGMRDSIFGYGVRVHEMLDENDEPVSTTYAEALMDQSPPTPEDLLIQGEEEQSEHVKLERIEKYMLSKFDAYERDVVHHYFEHQPKHGAELHGKTKTCYTRTLNKCLAQLQEVFG